VRPGDFRDDMPEIVGDPRLVRLDSALGADLQTERLVRAVLTTGLDQEPEDVHRP
jgi:hypothetical protein